MYVLYRYTLSNLNRSYSFYMQKYFYYFHFYFKMMYGIPHRGLIITDLRRRHSKQQRILIFYDGDNFLLFFDIALDLLKLLKLSSINS